MISRGFINKTQGVGFDLFGIFNPNLIRIINSLEKLRVSEV